ncbi:hypothetical protein C7N43_04380 [Sphingobacteriales bacterium UPWRP_1]|nr:hypothetical protein B6N25_04920 [Sphingobacteriales bacterium TSM_CSS]PSJ78301.1 hypothetical protein C7N43_04380 [Sphingobacteriales bacterium UPWRP_1]
MKPHKLPFVFTGLYLAAMCTLAFIANGTGDEGDSVSHYLFARYAFQHTANFLDHWAKPLFVLLAAPFAQLGFVGVKLMNIGFGVLAAWLTYHTARRLTIPHAWAAMLFVMLAPMHIYLTLSGLTEPLFALWLIAAVYLAVRGQVVASVIWVSFLPFVRSEGLVILCVYVLYLLFTKKWQRLPLLLTGHAVYSVAGYFYYGSLWWVFTKIPYASNSSVYGSGKLLQFVKGLQEVIGPPMYVLLGIGLLYGAFMLFKNLRTVSYRHMAATELWLVYGCFTAYVAAHTVFWYFGLFKSFGLLRVLVGIVPLSAIICLRGLNALSNLWGQRPRAKNAFTAGMAALVFAFTLFGENWKNHLLLRADQQAQTEMANYLGNRFDGYKYFFDAPYIAMLMNVDIFDKTKKEATSELFTGKIIPDKSLVIWDDWYSVVDNRTNLEMLTGDNRFELLRSFEKPDPWGNRRATYVFQKKQFTTNANDSSRVTLFTTGFENLTPANAGRLDSLYAFEGKFAARASSENPYSLGFDLPLSEISRFKGNILRAEAQVLVTQKEPNPYKQPLLIISFENEKSYGWNPLNLQDLAPEGKWQHVSFETTIPNAQTPADRVKVYMYNPSAYPAYLDSLAVMVAKPNN